MHSVRTELSAFERKDFEKFLKEHGMETVLVGDYQHYESNFLPSTRLCYAYSDKDEDAIGNIMCMILKYGRLDYAYVEYILDRDDV